MCSFNSEKYRALSCQFGIGIECKFDQFGLESTAITVAHSLSEMSELDSDNRSVSNSASFTDIRSPIEYVRSLLGKRLVTLLLDGPVIVGIFEALNWNGNLTMTKTIEYYDDCQRELESIVCLLQLIQEMEIREEIF
jgi:hypothetical protein